MDKPSTPDDYRLNIHFNCPCCASPSIEMTMGQFREIVYELTLIMGVEEFKKRYVHYACLCSKAKHRKKHLTLLK